MATNQTEILHSALWECVGQSLIAKFNRIDPKNNGLSKTEFSSILSECIRGNVKNVYTDNENLENDIIELFPGENNFSLNRLMTYLADTLPTRAAMAVNQVFEHINTIRHDYRYSQNQKPNPFAEANQFSVRDLEARVKASSQEGSKIKKKPVGLSESIRKIYTFPKWPTRVGMNLTCSAGNRYSLRVTSSLQEVARLPDSVSAVLSATHISGSTQIVVSHSDNCIKVYQLFDVKRDKFRDAVRTREILHTDSPQHSLLWSESHKKLFSGGSDGVITLWSDQHFISPFVSQPSTCDAEVRPCDMERAREKVDSRQVDSDYQSLATQMLPTSMKSLIRVLVRVGPLLGLTRGQILWIASEKTAAPAFVAAIAEVRDLPYAIFSKIMSQASQSDPSNHTTMNLHNGMVTALLIDEKQRLLSASRDGDVLVSDIELRQVAHTLRGHKQGITCLDISRNSHLLVGAGYGTDPWVWDLHNPIDRPRVLRDSASPHLHRVVSVVCSTDLPQIISVDVQGLVKVWDTRMLSSGHTRAVHSLDTSLDLPVRDRKGHQVTDMCYFESTSSIAIFTKHTSFYHCKSLGDPMHAGDGVVTACIHCLDLNVFITASGPFIRTWCCTTGEVKKKYRITSDLHIVTSMCAFPESQFILIATSEGTVCTTRALSGDITMKLVVQEPPQDHKASDQVVKKQSTTSHKEAREVDLSKTQKSEHQHIEIVRRDKNIDLKKNIITEELINGAPKIRTTDLFKPTTSEEVTSGLALRSGCVTTPDLVKKDVGIVNNVSIDVDKPVIIPNKIKVTDSQPVKVDPFVVSMAVVNLGLGRTSRAGVAVTRSGVLMAFSPTDNTIYTSYQLPTGFTPTCLTTTARCVVVGTSEGTLFSFDCQSNFSLNQRITTPSPGHLSCIGLLHHPVVVLSHTSGLITLWGLRPYLRAGYDTPIFTFNSLTGIHPTTSLDICTALAVVKETIVFVGTESGTITCWDLKEIFEVAKIPRISDMDGKLNENIDDYRAGQRPIVNIKLEMMANWRTKVFSTEIVSIHVIKDCGRILVSDSSSHVSVVCAYSGLFITSLLQGRGLPTKTDNHTFIHPYIPLFDARGNVNTRNRSIFELQQEEEDDEDGGGSFEYTTTTPPTEIKNITEVKPTSNQGLLVAPSEGLGRKGKASFITKPQPDVAKSRDLNIPVVHYEKKAFVRTCSVATSGSDSCSSEEIPIIPNDCPGYKRLRKVLNNTVGDYIGSDQLPGSLKRKRHRVRMYGRGDPYSVKRILRSSKVKQNMKIMMSTGQTQPVIIDNLGKVAPPPPALTLYSQQSHYFVSHNSCREIPTAFECSCRGGAEKIIHLKEVQKQITADSKHRIERKLAARTELCSGKRKINKCNVADLMEEEQDSQECSGRQSVVVKHVRSRRVCRLAKERSIVRRTPNLSTPSPAPCPPVSTTPAPDVEISKPLPITSYHPTVPSDPATGRPKGGLSQTRAAIRKVIKGRPNFTFTR